MTPGCRRVLSFLSAFLASGRRDLLDVISKEKMLQLDPSSWRRYRSQHRTRACPAAYQGPYTFLVPLCRVQMDSSMSTRSPKEYGKGGPEAMAEATADFRKSMACLGATLVEETVGGTFRMEKWEEVPGSAWC